MSGNAGAGTGADSVPPGDVLREELARLLDAGGAPDAGDALDVLWIARLSGLDPVDWSLLGNGTDPTAPPPAAQPPAPPAPDVPPAADPAPEPPSARLHLPGGAGGTGSVRPGGAHAIRVAQPQALTDALALTRALRPLRQAVSSTRTRTLDVAATAAASGDTGLLLPILRPATERRFSVDLLVDTGATMTVWHRLADELRTLLARHGAFADVRAWALNTDGTEPTLAPFRRGAQAASPTRHWKQSLADPAGRRAVLLLTDGVGPAWYGGELPDTLADWSVRRPVAALQVLPSRLWHRTALRAVPVRARGTDTGRAVIEVRSSGPLPGIARGRAGEADRARIRWLPALEVSGDWLAPWARLVSGRTTDPVPLRAVPLTVVERPAPAAAEDQPNTPAQWIERFEEGYSPQAFALVRLLAAAPLSLPVMRLVQRTMLPASTPMHLAEIFLSGLLVRRTPAEPGEDPDCVLYDFRDGVREALLDRLTRTESLRVLERVVEGVSERVAATFGGVTDFGALVAAVQENGGLDGLELPEGSRAFAEVAMAVIGGVGGDYGEVAARLTRGRVASGGGVARRDAEEVTRPRERRRRRFSWLRRRWEDERTDLAEPLRLSVRGDGQVVPRRQRAVVPSRVPEPPPFFMLHDEFSAVAGVLLTSTPPPDPARRTCVVDGAAGVGKTTLAAHCAQHLAVTFTLVRWIRAHSREALLEDLMALADDLGVPGAGEGRRAFPVRRLVDLRDYLTRHPDWLLVYDGVTSETFRSAPDEATGWVKLCLPPEEYGSLLVTCDEGAWWPGSVHLRMTLREPDRETAVGYLAEVAGPRSNGRADREALAVLVDLVGTSPAALAEAAATLVKGDKPARVVAIEALLERKRVQRLLRSLVWITSGGKVVGTGVAVRPNAVLTSGIDPSSGSFRVHPGDGRVLAVSYAATYSEHPGAVTMVVGKAVLPVVQLSLPGERMVGALWYSLGSSKKPICMADFAYEGLHKDVPGAVLFDADGRLHSMVVSDGDTTTRRRVTPELVERRARRDAPQGAAQVRDRASPSRPLFFLSYAREPATTGGRRNREYRFFTDLTKHLASLTDIPKEELGFFDVVLPVGADWQAELKQALATAQVFVPLYSPRYFTREWCGKEWDAFSRREQREGRVPGSENSAVVPVLWTPTAPRPVPAPAFGLSPSGGREGGMLELMESERRDVYEREVNRIARTILETARKTRLSPCDPSLFEDLRNVFAPEED
ncbi:TIR-like protein FxsC [Streptomyces sp. NPDC007808]|uniref:TIR-like protein FxsC n=1 Tax=Streptomyces sp. NPDC007808 TaxID=3364779 RepID=UPI0036A00E53